MKLLEWIKSLFKKDDVKYLGTAYDNRYVSKSRYYSDPDGLIGYLRQNCANMTSGEITESIEKLPESRKIEAVELAQKYLTPYDLSDIAINGLDQDGKIEALDKFQNRLDLEDIYKIFDNITPDKRMYTLKKCVDRFESLALAELIDKYIPLYERLDALTLYHDRLDDQGKALIIKALDPDRKIIALKEYGKALNRTDLNEIICNTEEEKVFSVLSVVYNDITSSQIEEIITLYIPEEQKLAALYMCCNRLNSSEISDIIKFAIPENQKEEALVSLQNRLRSNNIGEIFQFYIKSAKALKKLEGNLDKEDLEFFNKNN